MHGGSAEEHRGAAPAPARVARTPDVQGGFVLRRFCRAGTAPRAGLRAGPGLPGRPLPASRLAVTSKICASNFPPTR